MPRLKLRHWPLLLALALVIALAVWVRPRRIEALTTLDGRQRWLADSAAPTTHYAWQPGETLAALLPPREPPDAFSHPCLTDHDRTLYFTLRRSDGDADIYRSQWAGGRWQQAEPVTELNTPWDEEGLAVSRDGQQLVLASNRRGGRGGFDLYLCHRRAAGWGVPRNLGDAVNTPGNEFDPALTSDGLWLYFVSDRTANGTTDLCLAHRSAVAGNFGDVTALLAANSPHNERSPCIADEGSLIYFASDRPSRGRAAGLDLYRGRLSDPTTPIESLGAGINTSANEADPAVLRDGFHLIFSRRDAGAAPVLLSSKLAEVQRLAVWDTSRWQALRAVGWKALLAAGLFAALVATVYYGGGWLRRGAVLARFLAASFVLHAVVLWLMILVPLSQEIVKRVEEIRVSDAAARMFDDNLHQSHSPGEQAYEKVADLKGVETVETPQNVRQVVEPTNVPLHADSPVPTLTADLARRLPAERLVFVPPSGKPAPQSELAPRPPAPLRLAQIEQIEVEPPRPVAAPRETPLEERVELAQPEVSPLAARDLPRELPLAELALQTGGFEPPSGEAGGPRRAGSLQIGTLAMKRVDAPPSTSPLATQLQRPSARATPVLFAEDNVGMQAMFALRQGDTRREFIDLVGGNEETEQAVRRGLKWLAEHQHADGRWSLHQLDPPEKNLTATSGAGGTQSNTAATGLGLLPFLASGHTQTTGEHQAVVGKALQWLVAQQKPDGNLFNDPPSIAFMYAHAIATIALCEAYGMTQDERLRQPAQRALDFIVAAQNQGTGGWRYQPGESGDTSVVGWQVMALKSGEMAGLNVPKASLDLAGKWLDSAAGTGGSLGTFGYQGPGASAAMTAEGLLCRQFLGTRRNDPAMLAGAKYLLQHLPQAGQESSYYWYYATQVMYHMQGDYWTAWNDKLRGQLVSSQIKDGHMAGTWDPRDSWEQSGGRLYATSIRLLMLEVYYRHLPLYQRLE
ncbi:MAG TPA: hypothetical protein VG125_29325 [Pirellulales bacterium]|jgi:hypothetical protein|nr:hypothetical protein [Pirellulales bacterium]